MAVESQETMGEIIAELFEEYLRHYQDDALASVATAATINELLNALDEPPQSIVDDEQAA